LLLRAILVTGATPQDIRDTISDAAVPAKAVCGSSVYAEVVDDLLWSAQTSTTL